MFKEIMNAFKLHSEHIGQKFDKRFDEMDKPFDKLETKIDGIRLDLTEPQKTINFLLRKVTDHDEKLLELSQQQK